MSSPRRPCKIRLLDEVSCVIVGLHGDHTAFFMNKYAVLTANYFFNPKYKLGVWDGKIKYFKDNGRTYVFLLEEILPLLHSFGYAPVLEDLRTAVSFQPDLIDANLFAHVMHPDTGQPIVLRDYQVRAVNALIEHSFGLINASTGSGKAQPLTSKILTPHGWKLMGDIHIGDKLINPNGSTSTVTGVFPQGEKPVYKVTFHDGATTECCDEHLWTVSMPLPSRPYSAKTMIQTVSLSTIRSFFDAKHSNRWRGNVSVQTIKPFEYDVPTNISIPPYLLGVILGDGHIGKCSVMISSLDDHIIQSIAPMVEQYGISVKKKSGVDWDLTSNSHERIELKSNRFKHNRLMNNPMRSNVLMNKLVELGLNGTRSGTKSIPPQYKTATLSDRMQLIKGLFDTDGTVSTRGNVSYTTISYQLAQDVQDMIRAIGGTCTITSRLPAYTYKGERKIGKLAYTLRVSLEDRASLFSLPRKINRCKAFGLGRINHVRRITSIEPIGVKLTQCIMVDDPNHLYVTDDYIVTHNTLITASLCEAYGRGGIKTLTIVPSQDLIRQTKADFINCQLSTGEYSGTLKDLDKQHVVSTWQALKNNPKVIMLFGMVLVDEVHTAKGKQLQAILTEHAAKIPYRFGVTGTIPKDPSDELSIKVALGPVRELITAHELMDRGILAQIDINAIQLVEDLEDQYNEFCKNDLPISTPPTYAQFKEGYFPDFASEKSYIHRRKPRIEWIADFLINLQDTGKGNIMTFVDSITFGRQIVALIPGAIFVNGVDMKTAKQRAEVYDLFKDRDDLIVIATVHIAGTGLNIRRINELVTIDIGKSFVRVIQSIGRGARTAHDKTHFSVHDLSSDLKYGKRHLTERVKYYKDAQYPFKKTKVDYIKTIGKPC